MIMSVDFVLFISVNGHMFPIEVLTLNKIMLEYLYIFLVLY